MDKEQFDEVAKRAFGVVLMVIIAGFAFLALWALAGTLIR